MLPQDLLLCQSDINTLSAYVNQAQEQLIMAAGETGWWGCHYKTVFNVLQSVPYITCPREIARVAGAQICRMPVRIQNDWYEFLEAGVGQKPVNSCTCQQPPIEMYDRGSFPTAYDVPSTASYIRAYYTNALDVNRRVLITGLDQNGNKIYSLDGSNNTTGFFLSLDTPYVTSTFLVSAITGVQKDVTMGDVVLYAVDPTTGAETLLARYAPTETIPSLRRYYLNGLPVNCCDGATTAQVTVQAKMEFVPVSIDTDFLLIGNLPALIEECKSIRHGKMDSPEMKQISIAEHKLAIMHLNNELKHYMGTMQPAISFAPCGTANPRDRMIGRLV